MNTSTPREVVAGIVRHLATTGGGYLVGSGYMSEADMMMLSGALATAAGVAWSAWQKIRKNRSLGPVR